MIKDYINILKTKRIDDKKKEKEEKRKEKINNLINKITISNINFSKLGWVKEVSKILNIKQQKVNGWMKKNMKEFYEKNCFKRGSKLKDKNNKRIEEIKKQIELQKKLVMNSNIDFSKFGWVNRLSLLLNFDSSSSIIWLAKYEPDILNNAYSSKDYTELIKYYENNPHLLYSKKQYHIKNSIQYKNEN